MRKLFPLQKRGGFTLPELMVGLGIFAVGISIAYPLLVSDINLYARNFSINKSNNSLRHGLQKLKNDIDMALEPPVLMSYNVTGTTGTLTPMVATTKSADAILLWVNLGPAYDMAGSGAANTIDPTKAITLKRHVYSAADPTPSSPVPQIGDRLIILFPVPYSIGMPDNITMNGQLLAKPGRRITGVNIGANDTTTAQFTVNIDVSTTALPAGIVGDRAVYIAREVAYAANTLNVNERQLVYYPSTSDMTKSKLIIRDLDPVPQTPDAYTGSTLAFHYGNSDGTGNGRGGLTPLRINLPIRAMDYAHAIADRNMGGQTVNSSATEFNVFLRSNPQMGVKERLD